MARAICCALATCVVQVSSPWVTKGAEDSATTGQDISSLTRELYQCEPKGFCEFKLLSAIARRGPSSTPVLLDYARRAPWDLRPYVVQDMAGVVDGRAVPFLVESLSSPDWRLTLAAMHVLGRQGDQAKSALSSVSRIERLHWMPRVRSCAAVARIRIETNDPTRRPSIPRCDFEHITGVEPQCLDQSYPREEGWKRAMDIASKPLRDPWITKRYFIDPRFVTHAVAGGTLVGVDRGQYGGDLLWTSRNRWEVVARDTAIFAIVPASQGLLIIQGSSGFSQGRVSTLRRLENDRWAVNPLVELPHHPVAFRLEQGGGLAIATEDGTLVLGRDTAVQRFDCQRRPAAVGPGRLPY